MQEMPTQGGTYIRDPKTNALTRLPDAPADAIATSDEAVSAEAAPIAPEPAKKGGK